MTRLLILSLAADPALHEAAVKRITPPLMIDEHVRLFQAEVAKL